MAASECVAVVMAGGSGTRFWPLSRPDRPKQYLNLMGEKSLIQETVERLNPLLATKDIFVCSSASQEALLTAQLPQLSGWILEPQARNTAACLMLSAHSLIRRGYADSTTMIVLPADHHIGNVAAFRTALELAVKTARESGSLVTLGIKPDCAHTGYGYIEAAEQTGAVRPVRRFVEKPDARLAQQFFESGKFSWNSGIFIWTLKAITEAFKEFLPDAWRLFENHDGASELASLYAQLPSLPIDIAVLEKAANVVVIPVDMAWSDIGSWSALHDLQKKDAGGNATLGGSTCFIDSSGCLVRTASGKKVALVGVQDLVVIEEGDTILVVSRAQDQKVRQAAEAFKEPPTKS